MPFFHRRSTRSSSSTSPVTPSITRQSMTGLSSLSSYPLISMETNQAGYHVPTLFSTFVENFKYRWVLPKKEKRIRARILLQYSSHCLLWMDRVIKWENPWLTFAVGYFWTILCHFYTLIYSFGPGWIALAMLAGYLYVHFSFFPENEKQAPSFSSSSSSSFSFSSPSTSSAHTPLQARTHPKNQTPPSLLESTRELTYFTYTVTQLASDALVYGIDLVTWETPTASHRVLLLSVVATPCWWLLHLWVPANYVLCVLGWAWLVSHHPKWRGTPTQPRHVAYVHLVVEETVPRVYPMLPPRLPVWIEQWDLPADGALPGYVRGVPPPAYLQLAGVYQREGYRHAAWSWVGSWGVHSEHPVEVEDGGNAVELKRVWMRKAKCVMS